MARAQKRAPRSPTPRPPRSPLRSRVRGGASTSKQTASAGELSPSTTRAPVESDRVTSQDDRHLVIDGRAWRRTDPAIPEPLRKQLVSELMSARRAVQSAKKQADSAAERTARARVHDAKLALGERGAAWWEGASEAQQQLRSAATIRALLRHRGTEKTICPSEVARALGGPSWRNSMPSVRAVALALTEAGEIEIRQKGKVVEPKDLRGPIRLALPTARKPGKPRLGKG